MCGICGIVAPSGLQPASELVDAMCGTIVHRGPDDQGTYVRDGVALGMRRLSIIDLEGGHQPIHNEDESAWIVFNGEIYNYRALREELSRAGHRMYTHSDTEVVLHAYEQWGEGFLARLNGMFGLAIWDRRKRVLLLARDRLGIKPMHYIRLGQRLLFASEIKALLADPAMPREVDPVALADYLALEFVPTPRSILRGVRKVPPGHYLTWRQADGDLLVQRYWDVGIEASETAGDLPDLDSCATSLHAALKEAVRKELVADVPVGVFLSGGIDSSAVAAMMSELTPGNVNSFSIGFEDPSFDESSYARLVARHLRTTHRELMLEPRMLLDLVPTITESLDEPMADASIIPTYLLSKFTRQHVKVALGGDGGDELFAGYPTLQAHRLAGYYGRLPPFLRNTVVPALVDRLPVSMDNISFDFKARRFVGSACLPVGERHLRWMGSFTPDETCGLLMPDVAEQLAAPPGAVALTDHLADRELREPLNQVLHLDMKLYLENDILVKLDRASMMASLEARVPVLNVDFVEHVLRLPLSVKLHGWRSKYILKRAMRGVLPDAVLDRPKKGFGIPIAKWFRGPLRELLLDVLAEDRLRQQGYFQPEVVRRLIQDHLAGRRDNRKQLWTLFIFQRWHESYMRAAPVAQAAARSTA
jgi:asparagine synthase (glutamine-hydrolysing)